MIDLGSNPSPRDVESFRRGWQAAMRNEPEPEYPCGGLLGVALIWFVAGILVAGALLALTVFT